MAWVDVQGLGDEKKLRQIAEIFGVHLLALEDIVNAPQRPKIEEYDSQLLLIARMARLDGRYRIVNEQVSIFLGKNYVLTFQEHPGDVFDPVRGRLREGIGPIRRSGPDYLAYALLDTIVDEYYPVIESVGESLERLESRMMERPSPRTLD